MSFESRDRLLNHAAEHFQGSRNVVDPRNQRLSESQALNLLAELALDPNTDVEQLARAQLLATLLVAAKQSRIDAHTSRS